MAELDGARIRMSDEKKADSPLSRERFESLWTGVADQRHDPVAGLFGSDSISWRINRESALFLAAGRAALLQLAHPWVAAALDQRSNLRNDPLARFHHTFRVIFTMVFGTGAQALAVSQFLYTLHTRIEGHLPETVAAYPCGSPYYANEINALCWVYATLVESAVLAYESVLAPLTSAEKETYYAESKTLAALFGIPADALPADWSTFEAYNRAMWSSDALGINSLSREMAHRILHGRGSWVSVPGWYRALTTVWLPERFRAEFALPCRDRERASANRALRWLPRFYAGIPACIRFVGPYQEACARLSGRPPGSLARISNRFWMGQPYMMPGTDQWHRKTL